MKIFILVLSVLMGLLSIAAGAAKITLVPEEVEFLNQFGLNEVSIVIFGAFQTLGGLLLFIPLTRLYGAIAVVLGFTVSAVLVLVSGNLMFAAISSIPVALTGFLIYKFVIVSPDAEVESET